jgi:hypothetical protein
VLDACAAAIVTSQPKPEFRIAKEPEMDDLSFPPDTC